MWNLKTIEATNLCAFEHFKYEITQNNATLIFGNNMDNDSQNSNGSGKSALIEAIAIALTGETLRKVNMDEIINDRFDECTIEAFLHNEETGVSLAITRTIPRKGTQSIAIKMLPANEFTYAEDIIQATIADYNKYILDTLGLSKDDIYSNYILTAKKYKSFLSSSDREKKEIINRFSNGVLVDESIEALHTDMEPVREELSKAENEVATNNGKVSALASEIERIINESHDQAASRKERIESWKKAITDKRAYIRQQQAEHNELDKQYDALAVVDDKLQELEKAEANLNKDCQKVKALLESVGLEIDDYAALTHEMLQDIANYVAKQKDLDKQFKAAAKSMEKSVTALEKAQKKHDKQLDEADKKSEDIQKRIQTLMDEVKKLQEDEKKIRLMRTETTGEIEVLHTQLAGVIECPHCHHEFVLNKELDIDEARKRLKNKQDLVETFTDKINDIQKVSSETIEKGRETRREEATLANIRLAIEEDLRAAQKANRDAEQDWANLKSDLENIANMIKRIEQRVNEQRQDMFDEAFRILDVAMASNTTNAGQCKLNITTAEGAISSYEESIKDAEKAAETDMTLSLKNSKEKYEKALQNSILNKEKIEQQYNALQVQEATFMEFKTYLANIKIDAISSMTNEFLETIGSDIRVKLSGYTLLKSGKLRDKISVSLIRDGVDCGSFDKFSRGEQTRVELASILALHKLTNVNCGYGKGLNLLVFDEILDATDEQGLASVFKALNDTQITSLVVSHGNLAENYPNRLIINKQNGISFIS